MLLPRKALQDLYGVCTIAWLADDPVGQHYYGIGSQDYPIVGKLRSHRKRFIAGYINGHVDRAKVGRIEFFGFPDYNVK
jgi:hypothetical protein